MTDTVFFMIAAHTDRMVSVRLPWGVAWLLGLFAVSGALIIALHSWYWAQEIWKQSRVRHWAGRAWYRARETGGVDE